VLFLNASTFPNKGKGKAVVATPYLL